MRNALVVIGVSVFFIACAHQTRHDPAPSSTTDPAPPTITDRAQLDQHLGQLVTIRGGVTQTKMPTIIGVDVDAAYELTNQLGQATGILMRYTITEDDQLRNGMIVVIRPPGTYYKLTQPGANVLATASPVAGP